MWHLKGLFAYVEISLVFMGQSDYLRMEILPVFTLWLLSETNARDIKKWSGTTWRKMKTKKKR